MSRSQFLVWIGRPAYTSLDYFTQSENQLSLFHYRENIGTRSSEYVTHLLFSDAVIGEGGSIPPLPKGEDGGCEHAPRSAPHRDSRA